MFSACRGLARTPASAMDFAETPGRGRRRRHSIHGGSHFSPRPPETSLPGLLLIDPTAGLARTSGKSAKKKHVPLSAARKALASPPLNEEAERAKRTVPGIRAQSSQARSVSGILNG